MNETIFEWKAEGGPSNCGHNRAQGSGSTASTHPDLQALTRSTILLLVVAMLVTSPLCSRLDSPAKTHKDYESDYCQDAKDSDRQEFRLRII